MRLFAHFSTDCNFVAYVRLVVSLAPFLSVTTYSPCPCGVRRLTCSRLTIVDRWIRTNRRGSSYASKSLNERRSMWDFPPSCSLT